MQESGEKPEMRKIQNSASGVIISLHNWNMEIRIGIRKRKLRKTIFLIPFYLEYLEEASRLNGKTS